MIKTSDSSASPPSRVVEMLRRLAVRRDSAPPPVAVEAEVEEIGDDVGSGPITTVDRPR